MKVCRILPLLLLLCLPLQLQAAEVAGVNLPDSVEVNGKTLQLNGAGVRSKFFFDIYVAALYVAEKTHNPKTVIRQQSLRRVNMTFIYSAVEQKKITDGWVRGFEKNNSKAEMAELADRLARFNSFFTTCHSGDTVLFDFDEDGRTRVLFNGGEKGIIDGADFQQALLKVWFEGYPADDDLKEGMLGL